VTYKEIHECEVPKWRKKIAKIVCVFEKDLPTSFMDLQVHLLKYLVDDIELVGVISMRWMFLFERYD
jgi:hypothetical protein